ncbi:MAG: hypothetical protein RR506_01780 [Akkermansia sp.]
MTLNQISKRIAFSSLALFLMGSSCCFAESRTWTSADGNKTILGTATKYNGTNVTITVDGKKPVTMKKTFLCQDDQQWLEENKEQIGKGEATSASVNKGEPCAVAKQFENCTKVFSRNKTPKSMPVKPNAKYYLILSSASWCGPCCAEMPNIVKEYNRKIKNNPDLELIHKSADRNLESAAEWAKKEKINFPTIVPGTTCNAPVLSLDTGRGIPHLLIVTADGEKVIEGHPGSLLDNYEKEIRKYEENKGIAPSKK